MTTDTTLTRFDELNTWREGDQRAPHKPLLVLYALGKWQQGRAEVTPAHRSETAWIAMCNAVYGFDWPQELDQLPPR